ncbi:hypothetical protein ASG93_10930 [Paenibacillus sp. Soil787]|nr:hypothetical protein ASG93_10930 [Paenibacillus sp. Soil787]
MYFLQQSRENSGLACQMLHKVQQHTDKQKQEQKKKRKQKRIRHAVVTCMAATLINTLTRGRRKPFFYISMRINVIKLDT